MIRAVGFCAVAGLLVALCVAPASAAIRDATESGWIRNDNTGSSGGPTENAAGTNSASNAFRTLMQFDTGSLMPFTATDATLTLWGSDNSPEDLGGAGTVQVWLHLVIGEIAANEVNWLESSSGVNWTSPGGDYDATPLDVVDVDLGTFSEDDTVVFQSAGLTSAVQDAIDAGESLAVMVRTPALEHNLASGRSILWTKGFEADNPPELNVIPEPASMVLLGIGGLGAILRRRD